MVQSSHETAKEESVGSLVQGGKKENDIPFPVAPNFGIID